MNRATGTRHDNNAEQDFREKRRGIKVVSRNEGDKTRRALRIGISDDLFSRRNYPASSGAASPETRVRENPVPIANSDRLRSLVWKPETAIYAAVVTGLIVGFLIGRQR